MGVFPSGVRWKMYSWQSLRYRGELIGLKWPREAVVPSSFSIEFLDDLGGGHPGGD